MTRRTDIVGVARELLERDGRQALTMRTIAGRLGMRAPSLYKHIADKQELELALVADALDEQAALFEGVVVGSQNPVVSIAMAYRGWGRAHPHLYRLMNESPLPRDQLPDGLEHRAISPLLTALDGDRDRARAAWAFAHGMVSLEIAGRFPSDADLEAAWSLGLAGLASHATPPPPSRPTGSWPT